MACPWVSLSRLNESTSNKAKLTGVALRCAARCDYTLSRSRVTFRRLDAGEIRDYLATGEADDKAGAYAIQGRAAQFVVMLEGSFSGVMGLPLYETAQLLEARVATEAAHER